MNDGLISCFYRQSLTLSFMYLCMYVIVIYELYVFKKVRSYIVQYPVIPVLGTAQSAFTTLSTYIM